MDKIFNILCVLGALNLVFYLFFKNLMPEIVSQYFWPVMIIIVIGIGLIVLYENGIEKGRGRTKKHKRRRDEDS